MLFLQLREIFTCELSRTGGPASATTPFGGSRVWVWGSEFWGSQGIRLWASGQLRQQTEIVIPAKTLKPQTLKPSVLRPKTLKP